MKVSRQVLSRTEYRSCGYPRLLRNNSRGRHSNYQQPPAVAGLTVREAGPGNAAGLASQSYSVLTTFGHSTTTRRPPTFPSAPEGFLVRAIIR